MEGPGFWALPPGPGAAGLAAFYAVEEAEGAVQASLPGRTRPTAASAAPLQVDTGSDCTGLGPQPHPGSKLTSSSSDPGVGLVPTPVHSVSRLLPTNVMHPVRTA